MGLVQPELALNFRPTFIPKTITNFLNHVSPVGNIDSFLKRLEEEMKKIDAFKRELPLSMILLNDAIVALKEESVQCTARNVEEPVLEEFIPLKNNKEINQSVEDVCSLITTKKEQDSNNNYKDKKNWMSSVQLWNTDDDYCSTNHNLDTKTKDEDRCKNKGGARAFMPFKANSGFAAREEENEVFSVHGLTLSTPGINNTKNDSGSKGSRTSCSRAVSCSVTTNALSNFRSGPPSVVLSDHLQQQQQQASKKQRRCWSPELHRRFVNALQQLGGTQVATPKQIRELMHVDGLTNDEVKSHLQKYRLHTRRLPATTTTATTTTPENKSAVVSMSGRAWMSGDQYGVASKGSSSQSGSPQGPLHFTGGTSITGGDSMEDDEDSKSECYSWKSHVYKPGKNDV